MIEYPVIIVYLALTWDVVEKRENWRWFSAGDGQKVECIGFVPIN